MAEEGDKGRPLVPNEVMVEVSRPALDLAYRRELYSYAPPQDRDLKSQIGSYLKETVTCSGPRVKSFLYRRIPILEWLPRYQFKEHILSDFIAGLSVAVVHIPLGMGFALLASIPAICGIYMAFFPVLSYALLATSRHNSVGAFAIITMMTGKVVREYATFPPDSSLGAAMNSSSEVMATTLDSVMEATEPVYTPVQVAMIVCFMAGVWSVLLGFLGIGSVTVFFSDMLVSAFSWGSAVHVLTSQVPQLLGIKVPPHSGPLKIIYMWIDIFTNITRANIAAVVISIVSITIISINNELIKPRIEKLIKVSIPIELFIVGIGTTACYVADFPNLFQVDIVGDIPTGFPTPEVPPFSLAGAVAIDALMIAVVAFAGSYSLARIFADKHNYQLDPNQELYAMGCGNIFSSFFSCGPMAVAIARNIIQDANGGMTQLACLITSFFMLWVLLFLGPLFEYLPKACLSSIIVVALKTILMLVFKVGDFWKISRTDALLWLVTGLSVVIIDVSYGLIIGLVFAIAILIYRGQHPRMTALGQVNNTDIYLDTTLYSQAVQHAGIIIVKVDGSLHFANRENFKEKLQQVSGIAMKPKLKTRDEGAVAPMEVSVKNHKKALILDCQCMNSIDSSSAKLLKKIKDIYQDNDVEVSLAGLSDETVTVLVQSGVFEDFRNNIFHSVHDAILIIRTDSLRTNETKL